MHFLTLPQLKTQLRILAEMIEFVRKWNYGRSRKLFVPVDLSLFLLSFRVLVPAEDSVRLVGLACVLM